MLTVTTINTEVLKFKMPIFGNSFSECTIKQPIISKLVYDKVKYLFDLPFQRQPVFITRHISFKVKLLNDKVKIEHYSKYGNWYSNADELRKDIIDLYFEISDKYQPTEVIEIRLRHLIQRPVKTLRLKVYA